MNRNSVILLPLADDIILNEKMKAKPLVVSQSAKIFLHTDRRRKHKAVDGQYHRVQVLLSSFAIGQRWSASSPMIVL